MILQPPIPQPEHHLAGGAADAGIGDQEIQRAGWGEKGERLILDVINRFSKSNDGIIDPGGGAVIDLIDLEGDRAHLLIRKGVTQEQGKSAGERDRDGRAGSQPAGDGNGGDDADLAGRDRGRSDRLLGAGDGNAERVGGIERGQAGVQVDIRRFDGHLTGLPLGIGKDIGGRPSFKHRDGDRRAAIDDGVFSEEDGFGRRVGCYRGHWVRRCKRSAAPRAPIAGW